MISKKPLKNSTNSQNKFNIQIFQDLFKNIFIWKGRGKKWRKKNRCFKFFFPSYWQREYETFVGLNVEFILFVLFFMLFLTYPIHHSTKNFVFICSIFNRLARFFKFLNLFCFINGYTGVKCWETLFSIVIWNITLNFAKFIIPHLHVNDNLSL